MNEAVAKIVGVSNYKDAVAGLYVGATVYAAHEPTNEYDPNAYEVVLDNKKVGYLQKELAAELIAAGERSLITAEVIAITEYEGQVVGGIIRFNSDVPWLSINTAKEATMGTRVSDALNEQGREAWEGRSRGIRSYKLPANRPITVIPLTDVETQEYDGGWTTIREVAAFNGLRFGTSVIKLQDEGRANLIFFPAKDWVETTGSDGLPKMRGVTDTVLERVVPSEFDLRKPKGADDNWEPPKHPRPSKMTYVNCIFMDGDLEVGDRAKYNPKPGDHILLKMSYQWYEQWKRLMDRDRKKIAGYTPAGRHWTLKITGQIGNMAFEADDVDGIPVPLVDPVNLDQHFDTVRNEIEEFVAINDGIESSVFKTLSGEKVVDIATGEANDSDMEEFEAAIQSIAATDQVAPAPAADRSWEDTPPALMKKLLSEIGVTVPARPTKDDLMALCAEHDDALRAHTAQIAS